MALAFKRIMIITHNVQFAIDSKRTLESLGEYEVTTVTDARNAIEALQNQSHNFVLMDVENIEIPTLDMIKTIRSIQDDVAIVLAPDLPDVHDIAGILDVQGVVDIPVSSRILIPIIETSVRDIFDNLPETAKAPAVDTLQETIYIETLVDNLLGDDDTPYFTSRQVKAQKLNPLDKEDDLQYSNTIEVVIESNGDDEKIRYVDSNANSNDPSILLFQRLAAEEPPMPTLNQSGTISDLARNVTQSNRMPLVEVDEEAETEAREIDDGLDEELSDSIPAILVLQTALDETTPIEAISLKTLFENIQNRLPSDKQSIRPLPSWLKESEKFIREPIFMREDLEYLDSQRPMEYTSTNTQASDGTLVVSDAGNLETEVIESDRPFIADSLIDEFDVSEVMDSTPVSGLNTLEIDEAQTPIPEDSGQYDTVNMEDLPKFSDIDDAVEATSEQPPSDDDTPTISVEDPYLAQLAVTLTQVTTELTAEATILTRENVIVAYSGEMPMEDIDDVRMVINDDWSASQDNARIRFITLPSSGRDYMLYSKGTVGGFTLSMVFAGTRQLRVIRRQGERLIGALETTSGVQESEEIIVEDIIDDVPQAQPIEDVIATPIEDMKVESDGAEPIDVGPKLPYTFIWLTQEYDITLSEEVAKKLLFWLEVQLNSLHWTIHKLDVHQDFIYLFADVPGDLSPSTLIRNLKERSHKIVYSEDDTLPENLWADAYLVLTPGREMTDKEIQRFLNFARDEV